MKNQRFTIYRYLLITACTLLVTACLTNNKYDPLKDCSVASRCETGEDLAIRLRQVETYYFERETDDQTSFIDIAQFDYNNKDQWIGGITRRVAESDFDYVIAYDNDGRMTTSKRTYYDDLGYEAELELTYTYGPGEQLSSSISNTRIYDENKEFSKEIDETISYDFQSGILQYIIFDVSDSQLGDSSFRYTLNYNNGGNIGEIRITHQSNGKPDFTFKDFTYRDGQITDSRTYRLNNQNEVLEQENISYDYFLDGPIKRKVSIINTNPKQKIETRYRWEAGKCATNQTFGDRLFPTPEVENFPCH